MLSERKRRVLKAVVYDYIHTAEPVGSRTLTRQYNLGVSPATIRNEMADLGDMGYLEQPHTSAGRIPSSKGYRYYVDCLMEVEKLNCEEEATFQEALKQRLEKLDLVFRQATKVLSQVSQYTTLLMSPLFGQQVFQQIRMIPLDSRFVVVLLITDAGLVQHRLMEVPPGVPREELERIAHTLTKRLSGTPIEKLNEGYFQGLYSEFSRKNRLLQKVFEGISSSFKIGAGETVYLGGTTNILKQPEFSGGEGLADLLGMLEEKEPLCKLLMDKASEEVTITIGNENEYEQMRNCSMVTASYELHGRVMGVIGVLGPTRMNYGRVVSMVEFMQKLLSDTLCSLLG